MSISIPSWVVIFTVAGLAAMVAVHYEIASVEEAAIAVAVSYPITRLLLGFGVMIFRGDHGQRTGF